VLTRCKGGADDHELAHVDLRYISKEYSHPHMVGHRANLADALFKGCQAEPAITIHFSHSLEDVKRFSPTAIFTIKPRHGNAIDLESDILLAADGIKSVVRTAMLKELNVTSNVEDTGQAAYRILIPRQKMHDDPELLALIDGNRITRWIGEKRHIIAYPVAHKTIYNVSTVQPDSSFTAAPDSTYTTQGSKTKMLDVFSDFCPKVQKLLQLAPDGEVCEWKLRVFGPLPAWTHGAVALLGDAAHPTLPHLNQGAAQAIEDAAVLAVVLARMPGPAADAATAATTAARALRVYELVRKERAERLVRMAAESGRELHLGEGRAKEERDRQFALLKEGKGKVPDKWADADVQKMIYGHDCVQVAEDGFDELFRSLS
jgi:salicylate hydroxylase